MLRAKVPQRCLPSLDRYPHVSSTWNSYASFLYKIYILLRVQGETSPFNVQNFESRPQNQTILPVITNPKASSLYSPIETNSPEPAIPIPGTSEDLGNGLLALILSISLPSRDLRCFLALWRIYAFSRTNSTPPKFRIKPALPRL